MTAEREQWYRDNWDDRPKPLFYVEISVYKLLAWIESIWMRFGKAK